MCWLFKMKENLNFNLLEADRFFSLICKNIDKECFYLFLE